MESLQIIINIMKKFNPLEQSVPIGICIDLKYNLCVIHSLTEEVKVFKEYADMESYLVDFIK